MAKSARGTTDGLEEMLARRMANTGETRDEALDFLAKLAAPVPKEAQVDWWLSFCDPERVQGQQFLGVCIVPGAHIVNAIREAHRLGCNPGGEAQGHAITAEASRLIDAKWKGRLLTRAECDAVNAEVEAQKTS